MEVEAHIFYWTPTGMSQRRHSVDGEGYIARREVEELLEQAHARGKRQGMRDAESRRRDHGGANG
jgi:hypothetical protein